MALSCKWCGVWCVVCVGGCGADAKEKWVDEERRQMTQLATAHESVLKTLHKLKAETVEMDSEIQQYHEQLAKFAKR